MTKRPRRPAQRLITNFSYERIEAIVGRVMVMPATPEAVLKTAMVANSREDPAALKQAVHLAFVDRAHDLAAKCHSSEALHGVTPTLERLIAGIVLTSPETVSSDPRDLRDEIIGRRMAQLAKLGL